jgi:hypothetical protein
MFITEIMEFQLKSIKWMESELFILSVGALRDLSVSVKIFSSRTETVTGYCLRAVLLHQLSWCTDRGRPVSSKRRG